MSEFFYGRDWELQEALRLLRSGKRLLLLGARRIGKTELARAVIKVLETDGWQAKMVDIGGCADENAMVERLEHETNGLAGRALNVLNRTDVNIGGHEAKIHVGDLPWPERGAARFRELANAKVGALLVLDEAPVFLKRLIDMDKKRADNWLQMLRSWRMQNPNLRVILAGSIAINTLTQRHQFTTAINDLLHFSIEPFTAAQAERFLLALAAYKSKRLGLNALMRMLELIGWHVPHYHDMLFEAALQASRCDELSDAQQIDLGLERLLSQSGSFLQHWHDRLIDHGKQEADSMRKLLKKIASSAQGSDRSQLGPLRDANLNHYLDLLVDEGYLGAYAEGTSKHYVFRSELVRRWWAAR